MGKQLTTRNLRILVKRPFTLGDLLLKPSDNLTAVDAAGDGAKWHVRFDHGGHIDTVDWAKLEELEANGDISFDY